MGLVLSFLNSSKPPSNIIIDFENARPNATKSAVYEKLKSEMTDNAGQLLINIKNYGSGGRKIRGRLMGCKDATEAGKIFLELLPQVRGIKEFYDFAETLGNLLPGLAKELMGALAAGELEHQQAMLKLFADVLDFIRQFDTAKTYAAELQNDFSFYKRSLGKYGKDPAVVDHIPLNQEAASVVSLFLGPSGPMTTYLGDKMSKAFASEHVELMQLLANIANILCTYLMQHEKSEGGQEAMTYCMGAMVGAIVMYDYISYLDNAMAGVFKKSSKIDIKSCCKMIRGNSDLCACVRFSTKTYNSSASNKIRAYIEGDHGASK